MTVIASVPCHETRLKKNWNKTFFNAQISLGERAKWKHKNSQNYRKVASKSKVAVLMSRNCCDSMMNDTKQNAGVVSIAFVDVTNPDHVIKPRMAGRRKNGQQKNGKQKKNDGGNAYGRKSESQRNRRTSQGNGSSGVEGSGEGSGNGDESSDDEDDDDCDIDGEDEQDEEEEEEDDDEMEEVEEDTDNGSPTIEDEMEETANDCADESPHPKSLELKRLEFENPGPKVASGTLELQCSEDTKEKAEDGDSQNTMESIIAPAVPGTPVTLSGVIWKETMGGVLVVNLKWRNKMYCGSLIDGSRHSWATPRNLEETKESKLVNMSTSKRGKGKKGRHKGSAYTGNPLSPKMTASGKRGPRFHRNKGKHGKDSFIRPKSKRELGSDNTEEGTRTRRRSCTVKTSVSPSPSPTPLIECPERNCNKKYKHINGLKYHQQHAHHQNIADPEDKDSEDEDDAKSTDIKEPLSANSKSSGSDDVKPLSRRKAKNQKPNSSNRSSESIVAENSVDREVKREDIEESGEKFDVTKVKMEPEEQVKSEEKNGTAPNILEEAAKIIFDEPSSNAAHDLVVHPGIFARMTSQAMMVASQPGDYKYVSYEPMAETISAYTEKSGATVEVQDMDVTVKEEVIEEGNAGTGKLPCKDEAEETLNIDTVEIPFSREKPRDVTMESASETPETDKNKWSPHKEAKSASSARKSAQADELVVSKETNQQKTSAAEIRSLPGYQHFRLSPNNSFSGHVSQASDTKTSRTITLEAEVKETQKCISGLIKDNTGTPKLPESFEKQGNKPLVWTPSGTPSVSTASFQLSCETNNSSIRPRYIGVASSKKPSAKSVVTASTTWVPEVHPALTQKVARGSVPGQEVVPEKPLTTRETADKPVGNCRDESEQDEKTKNGKNDDEKPKGSFAAKHRAVGVAHPFNAEKSEGEFSMGSIGSISSEPLKMLYSKSCSPKVSLDLTHPDMTEVKKVRVEKTLEVPVGEVVPLAKTRRAAVTAGETRDTVMVGEGGEHYGGVLPDSRASQAVNRLSPHRDPSRQPSYTPSATERSSPWRPQSSYSPSRDPGSQTVREPSQRYTAGETSDSILRKTHRRSPNREMEQSPHSRNSSGGYLPLEVEKHTPDKRTSKKLFQRVPDQRVPFCSFDEPPRRDNPGIAFRETGRSSPEKFTSRRFPVTEPGERLMYRDSERRSPHREKASSSQRREDNRSPLKDPGRLSPGGIQLSSDRETFHRTSYRDTSPNPTSSARHSPYREPNRSKQSGEGESVSRRRDSRSPEIGSRAVETARGYSSVSEGRATKEGAENRERLRASSENKFPRMTEEEAIMFHLRQPFYQYQNAPQDSATREAMENYMMYLRRLPIQAIDPRLLQAYPMLSAAQMPLLLQASKETSVSREERMKDVSEETRSKSAGNKNEVPRSRGLPFSETTDVELPTKRHLDCSRLSSSKGSERTEYESTPSKRTKTGETKDEIIDEREGSRIQFKKLEQQVLQQAYQQKMDAFNQLQTEKSLKQKAEEKNNSRSKISSGNSSRLKPGSESRTSSKKEDALFCGSRSFEKEKITSKEDKSRISPINRSSASTTSESAQSKMSSRNSENKSPSAGGFPGFLGGAPNLPSNHGLSNSYEQAALHMQGIPPLMMSSPFPGIMMTPLLAGAPFHNAIATRNLDSKRDHSRGSSSSISTNDRGRTRDDEGQDVDTREYSSQAKKEGSNNKNTSTSPTPQTVPKPHLEKERSSQRTRRTDESEGDKQRTLRDNHSLHGSQGLPSNLAFRRGNMTSGVERGYFNQDFPRLMYPPSGNYRPPFDNPYVPYSRK